MCSPQYRYCLVVESTQMEQEKLLRRVTKVPSKKAPQALRTLLDDYHAHALDGEYYKNYFRRQGKMYFYDLLKPVADLSEVSRNRLYRLGSVSNNFLVQTAVGECAGVIIDLVSTLLYDSDEKFGWSEEALANATVCRFNLSQLQRVHQ
jgi:sulfite reductase (ferredoxin)